ncbi:MAG: isoaspartyl peptidase/L-asparaginase [Saprospirales bacterium]|nr:MAG: isoaspartyl peptidase/L-asparaginase [Saprospirales bacterium]
MYKINVLWGLVLLAAALVFSACESAAELDEEDKMEVPEYVMVVHGGAGVFALHDLPEGRKEEYIDAIEEALDIGEEILANGGSGLDAVVEVISLLEDNPIFNAGKGAVFTNEGVNELDASIMSGKDMDAGAVGGVTTVKNPIVAARKVMEKSPHVLLTGRGANQFAASVGCEIVDNSYFFTEERYNSMLRARESEAERMMEDTMGTVGVAVLDASGNLYAGTSTGGMTNKRFGRIGDSPIIGAGTYADNDGVAVSCTGHGEYFIRYAVAYDLNALVKYRGISLDSAATYIIHEKLIEAGGLGGLIAVDRNGNYSMPFNTNGMIRGVVKPGFREVAIYD